MSMLQVNQLRDVVSKKEAEITVLHTTIEQLEKVDDTAKPEKSKPKPTNASKPRRRTSNEPPPQRGRKTTTENGNANAEVCVISSRFNVLCMPLHTNSHATSAFLGAYVA